MSKKRRFDLIQQAISQNDAKVYSVERKMNEVLDAIQTMNQELESVVNPKATLVRYRELLACVKKRVNGESKHQTAMRRLSNSVEDYFPPT